MDGRWIILLFFVSFILFSLSYSIVSNLTKNDTVSWNARSNKCVPDVCHGSNIMEIASYNKQILAPIINSTILYDTDKTRKCLQDKFIVFLGDSSLTETVHDIIFLLSRLAVNDDLLATYMKDCIGHRDEAFNDYEFKIPHDSTAYVQLHPLYGHRNLTYLITIYTLDIDLLVALDW